MRNTYQDKEYYLYCRFRLILDHLSMAKSFVEKYPYVALGYVNRAKNGTKFALDDLTDFGGARG